MSTVVTNNQNFGGPNDAQAAAANAALKITPTVPTYQNTVLTDPTKPGSAVTPTGPGGFNVQNPAATPTPPTPPASEPTVLSSGNINDTVIPNSNAALANLSNKGQYSQDGVVYNADGTLAPASGADPNAPQTGTIPAGGTDNGDGTYTLDGLTYTNAPDPQTISINNNIASLKSSLDATTKASIDAIEQNYTALISQQNGINSQAAGARQSALLTGGVSRYSPDTASGIMQTQLSYGLQQIAKLDADENSAIAQAQQAQETGDSQLADKLTSDAQDLRTQKQTIATQLNDALSKANDDKFATQNQSNIDNAIAGQVENGVTDPAAILQSLSAAGMPATADQVAKTLTSILTVTGAGSVKNLTGDVKNFTALQQAGSLPASIAALPQEQQLAAYIAMVHAADKGTLQTALNNAGGLSTGSNGDPVATDSSGNAINVDVDADGNPDPTAQKTFLASLPGGLGGGVATLVQGLADYTINPTAFTVKNYAGATGMTQSQVLALVKQFDPTYDQKQYATASAMQKNVASGQYSQTITAANTLVQHLSDLTKSMDSLYATGAGNGSIDPSGRLGSSFNNKATLFVEGLEGGNASVKSFQTFAQAVAEEAAKVYKGSASPSEGEINQWASTLSPTNSKSTNQAAINAILSLMAGKLSTISSQYKQALGNTQGLQILTPQSISTLQSLGLDPADYDPTYDANSTSNVGDGGAQDFLSTPIPGSAADPSAPYTADVWANAQ